MAIKVAILALNGGQPISFAANRGATPGFCEEPTSQLLGELGSHPGHYPGSPPPILLLGELGSHPGPFIDEEPTSVSQNSLASWGATPGLLLLRNPPLFPKLLWLTGEPPHLHEQFIWLLRGPPLFLFANDKY